MVIINKIITISLCIIIATTSNAQDNTVSILGFGDGKTKDEATNAALRHCIEKTFGVFVTTNTQVVNDELVKDEVATIASGNIISYEILSELQKGENFSITVSAVVSPDNIVKTYKNKGYAFEINGSVYARNIQIERFYKEQEPKIVEDFLSKYIDFPIFDTFQIKIGEPFKNPQKQSPSFSIKKNYKTGEVFYSGAEALFFINEIGMNQLNKIIPNVNFRHYSGQRSNYMHLWNSQPGTLAISNNGRDGNDGGLRSPEIESFIIPISYLPNFNQENVTILSELLDNFFNKIAIKNIDYEQKFGKTYSAILYLLKSYRNKKGEFKGSINEKKYFKLRNEKSIEIINKFSELIAHKTNPNSIEIINLNTKFELNSGWFYQSFQNHIEQYKDEYEKARPSSEYERLINQSFERGEVINVNFFPELVVSKGYVTNKYTYNPTLLLLYVTENELSNLNKLEFKWR